MHNEAIIQKVIRNRFGVIADIQHIIVNRIPVSRSAYATLFLTDKKQLMLYISGEQKLLLGDIVKLVSKIGLKADLYLPPKNNPTYFNDLARNKFFAVFPGRRNISDNDLRFYRTLVPYNPALISICEVKDGHVYQYDSDSANTWRVATKFSYRRIKTS